MRRKGIIRKISGPTVLAHGLDDVRLHHRVTVGDSGLLGEVVRIHPDHCVIQVYEETTGLSVGDPVEDTGEPLVVELGPGLLSGIFDGTQRPLRVMADLLGPRIVRGARLSPLSRERRWPFFSRVKPGDLVESGDILGVIPPGEGEGLEHRVMVPPGIRGKIDEVGEGEFSLEETVARIEGREVTLLQRWPVRVPRPFAAKLSLDRPFITGQRVIDTLFPLPVGGSVILPGGFGTGKTILEQSLAKYSRADVVIYVACGERGNEMTEVLEDFPRLRDPCTGLNLMQRTILVVNTSNMPVAAREASIYTGITLAEYYRDMGYHAALMADSTSRWAEALREIASRMEEMPGEEGYPTTLGSRLAQFYERAGRVRCLGGEGREGAVTLCAAVSPPGGDFSEPVTQGSLRVTGALWALDFRLAHQRHYPAIHCGRSFSLYTRRLDRWYRETVAEEWPDLRAGLFRLIQREEEILETAQLVGPDALQDSEKLTLEFARIAREYYLRQNAYTPADAFCPLRKQYWMLKVFFHGYDRGMEDLRKGTPLSGIPTAEFRKTMEGLRDLPDDRVEGSAMEILEGGG